VEWSGNQTAFKNWKNMSGFEMLILPFGILFPVLFSNGWTSLDCFIHKIKYFFKRSWLAGNLKTRFFYQCKNSGFFLILNFYTTFFNVKKNSFFD
jgi:hypothetical protein